MTDGPDAGGGPDAVGARPDATDQTRSTLPLATPDSGVDAVTAVHHAPPSRRGAPVLLVPGAGGDLDDRGLVALAEALAALGHHVVRANLPYREAGRRGPPHAERSIPAYRQVLAAAQRAVDDTDRWIVGGKSFGGRVASLAVADGMAARGLLFFSYPLHPAGKPDRLRVAHWPRVTVPCLFLQGDRDPLCDLELLDTHVPTLAAPATVHVVAGGDHSLRVTRAASPTATAAAPEVTIAALRDPIGDWIATLNG